MNQNRSSISFFTGLVISLLVLIAFVLVAGSSQSRAMVENITRVALKKPPDAVDDTALTNNNRTITIDVLRNDSDADGDNLTVSIVTQPANGEVINNGMNVTYTPNPDFFGQDTFTYTASDGLLSDTAVVRVNVNRIIHLTRVPSADAGADQTAQRTATVQLNGGNSSDPDGDPLTFRWSFQSQPTGSAAVLFNPTAVDPTFVLNQPGIYVVQLIVNDGRFNSAPDTVQISTGNSAPVANAGADQSVVVTNTVTLNGSGSTDVDGNQLTFQWSFQSRPAGSAATLSNPAAVTPSFAVDRQGDYVLQLIVNDGLSDSAPDTVTISTQNSIPAANAGPDQSTSVGSMVQLEGSGSTDVDGDPLTFQWSFVSLPPGSTTALTSPTAVTPAFQVDQPGTYVLQLIVNDGFASSPPDTVMVTTENRPPVADAGPDQTVALGATVQLTGTGSSDPDNDPLTFTWSLLSIPPGTAAALSDPHATNPTFQTAEPGMYIAQLIVNDGHINSMPETVTISTDNSMPIAIAGPDQTVTAGATVELDGSTSSDADGTPLQYSWALTARPSGSVATLSNESVVNPTFVANLPGAYIAQLIVTDGVLVSAADTLMITAVAPVATLTGTDADAAEAGLEPGSFTVSRTGDLSFALTVGYSISGTATNGIDYTLIPTTITIPAGSSSAVITITPFDDSVLEDSESVVLTLLQGTAYEVGTENTATVTIADNDPPAVTIAATDPDAAEVDGNSGTFTISRTGPTTGSLTVNYTVNGSATNGADYTMLTTSVTIPAGLSSTTITVTPLDDTAFELPESVGLTLAAGSNYLVGSPSFAVVTIVDNDTLVSVVATDFDASEDGANPGSFAVGRNGPTTNAITVFYTIGGSATNGTDYATLAGSVTILAGSSTASVTITPIDDALFEGPETVVLSLSPDAAYTISALGAATVTVADDERPTVTIASTDDADEAALNPGTFIVTRTGPTTNSLTVNYAINGNATNGVDYQTIGTSLTIPAGSATGTVVITPIADNLIEGAESVILSISSNTGYAVGIPGLALMTLADDDLAQVTVTATIPNLTETGPTTGEFTFSRTGATDTSLILVCLRGGTASNFDYVSIGGTNFLITIPAGESSVTVPITPVADNLVEGDETVVVSINASLNYVLGTPSTATVTIVDDPPVVNMSATDSTAAEAGRDVGVFTFTRTGGNLAAALPVFFSRGGTASISDCFTIGAIATIPANQTSETVTITPLADNLVEGDETVTLTIIPNGISASYVIDSPSTGTVTIADDPAIVSVTSTVDPAASEAGPDPGVFTFARSGGDLTTSLLILVQPSGTATNGTDYASIGGSNFFVTIPANQTTATLTINPLPDNRVEGSETAVLTIQSRTAYVIGTPASATVTIADDPPIVTVTAIDADAAEAGQDPGVFSFTRAGGNLAAALTVSFTRSGSATNSSDYLNIGFSVTIPANQSSTTVTITPIDDPTVEGPETVTVTINASTSYVVGTPASAIVTIADND
jgi:hypothetical protein